METPAPGNDPGSIEQPKNLSDASNAGTHATPKPTELESRINQLVSATSKAEEIAAQTQGENLELKNMILSLTSTVEGLKQGVPAANPPSDPFTPPNSLTDPGSFDTQMKAAIESALSPITKRIADDDARVELQQKQAAVLQEVASTMPELRDPTSAEHQLFTKLYNGRPDIQKLPDAPRIVAEMTRGLMADKRVENHTFDVAKSRASAVPSMGPSRAPTADEANQINEKFDALVAKGTTDGFTDDDMGNYLHLKAAKVSLERQ